MRSSALSIKAFGVYGMLTGLGLLLAPAMLLSILGLPAPSDTWVRVLGALALVVGYYCWACGTAGVKAYFKATIVGRLLFFVLCALLVLMAAAPPQLMIFGVVDLLAAVWTAYALRAEEAW